jgi:hypothetical protein
MTLFHRHTWENRSVGHIRETWEGKTIAHTTDILRVCSKCDKPSVKNIDGTWTLEELKTARGGE